ncbi:hypothetical protein LR48_Vigan04g138800 [Vigna angularis]|uniref:PB1-like domain-containing protein n=1 Tax=Phaseolus angularis TaxID=3914 RepID=A0A0L9UE23_PHAAN|nr:hypothetical protein LR48_Vigan04g138800 [Vigna angularis]
MKDHFEVVFHHGGKFLNDGKLKYEEETSTLSFDAYMWSYFLVVSVVKGLRYDGFKDLWYCVGGGERGECDGDDEGKSERQGEEGDCEESVVVLEERGEGDHVEGEVEIQVDVAECEGNGVDVSS